MYLSETKVVVAKSRFARALSNRQVRVALQCLVPVLVIAWAARPASAQEPLSSAEGDPLQTETRVVGHAATSPGGLNQYTISYVESDRRWRLGFRNEPYNKMSAYLRDLLVEKLVNRGLTRLESADCNCHGVKIDLLEVTTHPAMFKKPGMDMSAVISVSDASGRQIYSKGYRGESRTVTNTYGHLINHAAENLIEQAIRDGDLLAALKPALVETAQQ